MSVGDVKGYRRRLKQAKARGHAPRKSYSTVAASIAQARAMAARLAQIGGGKKKG